MAQKVITQLVDDLDGKEIVDGAGETVSFALDGVQYEIDLSTKNADNFRGLFQDHIAVARKSGRGRTGGSKAKAPSSGSSNAAEIREWARSNGITVPERGRIPAEVRAAFEGSR